MYKKKSGSNPNVQIPIIVKAILNQISFFILLSMRGYMGNCIVNFLTTIYRGVK